MRTRKPLGNITNSAGNRAHSKSFESVAGKKLRGEFTKEMKQNSPRNGLSKDNLPFNDEKIQKLGIYISINPSVFKLLNYKEEKEMFAKYILPDLDKLAKTDLSSSRGKRGSYTIAKLAEFKERDLDKAQLFYQIAIIENDRLESAIKDLASVMHQKGNTQQACDFLQRCEFAYRDDKEKFQNLLKNLKKQIVPSGNWQNKSLVLVGVPAKYEESDVKSLFGNSSRIQEIEFYSHTDYGMMNKLAIFNSLEANVWNIALINFASHSAAKKTLESLIDSAPPAFWVNTSKSIIELALKPSADSNQSIQTHRSGFSSWTLGTWESALTPLEIKDEEIPFQKEIRNKNERAKESTGSSNVERPSNFSGIRKQSPLAEQFWNEVRMRENRARVELDTSETFWNNLL